MICAALLRRRRGFSCVGWALLTMRYNNFWPKSVEVPQPNRSVVLLLSWRKAACDFSLLVQRKVTKRKDPLRFARFAGSLRFSEFCALAKLASYGRSDTARSIAKSLRCSAASKGWKAKAQILRCVVLLLTFNPLVLHRAPESFAEKARRGAARTPRVFRRARDGSSKDARKG